MLRSTNPNAAEEAEKFEGFIAKLLYDLHLRNMEWNVVYTREDGSRRQVDVQYQRLFQKVIIECKYRTNPYARIRLDETRNENRSRNGDEKRHGGQQGNGYEKKNTQKPIHHLVDEVDERRMFARAKYGVLATNAYFGRDVIDEARRQRIELWDRNTLTEMMRDKHSILGIRKLCWKKSFDLEEMIKATHEKEYTALKGRVYRV